MENDIRWVQRFENFQKALARLEEAVAAVDFENIENILDVYSKLAIEGLIQRFEYTYELAWKTLQDLLKYKGYSDIKGPNPVLIQALQDGYITDRERWRKLKRARELTSHTYDEATANKITQDIVHLFLPTLKALETRLSQERDGIQQFIF